MRMHCCRKLCMAFLFAFLLAACAQVSCIAIEDAEEISLLDVDFPPYVYVLTPKPNESYESANALTVEVESRNVQFVELELLSEEGVQRHAAQGSRIRHTFTFAQPQTQGSVLTVRGYAKDNPVENDRHAELVMNIPSPREELIEKMIALAYQNSKDNRYRFAPAQEDWDIGVCKNFVMRLFDTFSGRYRMKEYPRLKLHMPVNNSKKACAPYDYGIEWKPETAADGSPFDVVAQFKYDESLSKEENALLARDLLVQIKKGDFFQIVGYYGGGNGPHSMYIIRDYDPISQMIHWTDSNMRGTRVEGVRWGYMQYDADADVEWWIEVFNRKKRGATLYRLREDLFIWDEGV